MSKSQKQWYIHDPLDTLNNPIKLQVDWIGTSIIHLKQSNTVVTLQHGHGHLVEQVKLNE